MSELLGGCARTCIAINRTYIRSPAADVHELYKNTVHHPARKKKGHDAGARARGSKVELFGVWRRSIFTISGL